MSERTARPSRARKKAAPTPPAKRGAKGAEGGPLCLCGHAQIIHHEGVGVCDLEGVRKGQRRLRWAHCATFTPLNVSDVEVAHWEAKLAQTFYMCAYHRLRAAVEHITDVGLEQALDLIDDEEKQRDGEFLRRHQRRRRAMSALGKKQVTKRG